LIKFKQKMKEDEGHRRILKGIEGQMKENEGENEGRLEKSQTATEGGSLTKGWRS
jgi:hypothetical protein